MNEQEMERQRLENKIQDLECQVEQLQAELAEKTDKVTELWTELNALRREADKGFDYYPGPSSNCVICDAGLTETEGQPNEPKEKIALRIAHGLCDECKPNFDTLHPGARVNPQAGVA